MYNQSKSKEDMIKTVESEIREDNKYPLIIKNTDTIVEIAIICKHGNGNEFVEICYDKNKKIWDGNNGGEYEKPLCFVCESKPSILSCPKCGEPVPELTSTTAIDFWRNDSDILTDTVCLSCGSKWFIEK